MTCQYCQAARETGDRAAFANPSGCIGCGARMLAHYPAFGFAKSMEAGKLDKGYINALRGMFGDSLEQIKRGHEMVQAWAKQ